MSPEKKERKKEESCTVPENIAKPGCPDLFLTFANSGIIDVSTEEIKYHRKRQKRFKEQEKRKAEKQIKGK